jgi:ribulose-phosphate 3-epimerase
MTIIAPSILSADFSQLGSDVNEVETYGADYIHIDVMDGHFVPNITIGPLIVKAVRKVTALPLDVHLMIENPDTYIPNFANAGADIITVHVEACKHLHRTIQFIKSFGKKAGVALNPATPLEMITDILDELDQVLIMTVNPGFGGQQFIESTTKKITKLNKIINSNSLSTLIEVDGGINTVTASKCKKAGASILVAGSYIFDSEDRKNAIMSLKI